MFHYVKATLFGPEENPLEPLAKEDRQSIAHEIDLSREKHGQQCADCSGSDDEEGVDTFDKLAIEYETPLYGTSQVPKLHFIVPTSQTDWQFEACSEKPDSVQNKIQQWCLSNAQYYKQLGQGTTLTTSVSSLPIDIMDIEVMKGKKNNVLLLPYFLWIRDLNADEVQETLDRVVPDLLEGRMTREQILDKYPTLSDAKENSFVFICSHTTRDKRCGVTAPILRSLFEKRLKKNGLYRDNSDFRPNGCNVQYINHVGGHKFAGNVQLYLKPSRTLVWLGRVKPQHVHDIVDQLVEPEVPRLPYPENVRCVKKYSW